MILEDFAIAGKIALFQGRCGKSGFGVKETGELGDEGFTL
jgi:hypothetical protein